VKYMIIVGILALGGCAALSTKVAPKVAKAVDRYCQEPQDSRLALRAQVNALTAPNSVQVNCAGDTKGLTP
jgi:hypothetical protein